MNHLVITWISIVVVLAVLLLSEAAVELRHHRRKSKIKLCDLSSEEELIYCPGDEHKDEESDF